MEFWSGKLTMSVMFALGIDTTHEPFSSSVPFASVHDIRVPRVQSGKRNNFWNFIHRTYFRFKNYERVALLLFRKNLLRFKISIFWKDRSDEPIRVANLCHKQKSPNKGKFSYYCSLKSIYFLNRRYLEKLARWIGLKDSFALTK